MKQPNDVEKTYRAYGWQEPKFQFGFEFTYENNIYFVVNYWRGYNGEFGYQVAKQGDGQNAYEVFEEELEKIVDGNIHRENI